VWTTKYRYKILVDKIAQRIRELIRQGCETRGVKIIKGSVGKSHIHILVSCPPSISVSKLVQYLKGRSSKIIQEEFPVLRKRYWGQHMWSIGYFCRSVGTITDEIIKEYIENQKDDIEEIFKILK
jgi:putative transposase